MSNGQASATDERWRHKRRRISPRCAVDSEVTLFLISRAVAVPSAHRPLGADAVATWSLPGDPLAARAARRHVRNQLRAWRLDELAACTEMLASELVTNVVRHARGPIRLRLLRGETLVCEVFDGSLTTPRIRGASWNDEGGRGLQLVAALSDRWGTRYMAEGKCIWTEQSLPLPKATPLGLRCIMTDKTSHSKIRMKKGRVSQVFAQACKSN